MFITETRSNARQCAPYFRECAAALYTQTTEQQEKYIINRHKRQPPRRYACVNCPKQPQYYIGSAPPVRSFPPHCRKSAQPFFSFCLLAFAPCRLLSLPSLPLPPFLLAAASPFRNESEKYATKLALLFDKVFQLCYNNKAVRGVAQFGSALGSGPRGRGFKSRHLDHVPTLICLERKYPFR